MGDEKNLYTSAVARYQARKYGLKLELPKDSVPISGQTFSNELAAPVSTSRSDFIAAAEKMKQAMRRLIEDGSGLASEPTPVDAVREEQARRTLQRWRDEWEAQSAPQPSQPPPPQAAPTDRPDPFEQVECKQCGRRNPSMVAQNYVQYSLVLKCWWCEVEWEATDEELEMLRDR